MGEKTYRTVYFDRIDKTPLTEEAIKAAYVEMLADNRSDWSEGDPHTPEELTRANLGYILGYYGAEKREAWYKFLRNVNHPIFGEHFGRTYTPTPEIAFKAGRRAMKKHLGDSPK